MELLILALLVAVLVVLIIMLLRKNDGEQGVKMMGDMINENQKIANDMISTRLENVDKNITSKLSMMEERLKTLETTNEQKLENIRISVEKRISYLQEDNNKKLDEMRNVVDEKLQKTLETKMTQSFQLVSERLEQVYKGLGEMQTLANGVGDLKKVLSNVKTRGILGEVQLGAILEEILSPSQYETNIITNKATRNPVEYAIRLPNEDGSVVYLPVDSKFPGDTYMALQNAQESGNPDAVAAAAADLIQTIKKEAKDIRDKYICPPNTTEFAIMFIPFEGLYAEIVNRGLVETLQRDYRVNVAGPSTMAALLNSLQMGFRTLAIQKRGTEVWNVLGAVKTEFEKFETILEQTQRKIDQANKDLDALVGVRTRAIVRKLKEVERLDETESQKILEE